MTSPLKDKVRSGLIWSAIQSWAVRLSSLILFIFLARLLQPSEIGLFAAANVVILLLNLIADQGLSEAVVQRKEVSEAQLFTVFLVNMLLALLVAALAFLIAPYISIKMGMSQLTDILRVAVFAVPMSAFAFGQLSIARRQFDYRGIALISLASTIISGSIALLFALLGAGVWSLVAQALVSSTATATLLWFKPRWKPSFTTDFAGIFPLLSYGLNRLATNLLDFFSTRYVEVFLATTLGPVALGIYSVGVRIHQALLQSLSAAILDVAHNAFSRLNLDSKKLLDAYYDSVSLTAAFAVPIFALVGGAAPLLTRTLFGETWADSADVMRLMAVLGAIQVIQYYNGTIYNAIGRPSIGLLLMPIKIALIVVGLHLSRGMSVEYVVGVFVLSHLPITPLSFLLVRHLVGVSLWLLILRMWPFLLSSLLTGISLAFFVDWLSRFEFLPLLKLLIALGGGAALYILLLMILSRHHLASTLRLLRRRED